MANEKVGTINFKDLPPLDAETAAMMAAELKGSVLLTIIYYVYLLAVTILNWTSPALMKTILWEGMTLTWFATSNGALFMAVFIAWLYVLYYQKKLA